MDVFSLSVLVLNGLFFLLAVWLFKELSEYFSKVTSSLCTNTVLGPLYAYASNRSQVVAH